VGRQKPNSARGGGTEPGVRAILDEVTGLHVQLDSSRSGKIGRGEEGRLLRAGASLKPGYTTLTCLEGREPWAKYPFYWEPDHDVRQKGMSEKEIQEVEKGTTGAIWGRLGRG